MTVIKYISPRITADFTDTSIWYVNRLNNGWSNAIKLDSPLNEHEVMTSTLAKKRRPLLYQFI